MYSNSRFRLARLGGLGRILSLQDLHAGLLIATDHQPALLIEARRVEVQPADVLGLGVKVGIVAVEPVDALVGLEVGGREDALNGRAAEGALVRLVDDGAGEVVEAPARGGLVMIFDLAAGQVDDMHAFVGGKSSGVYRSVGHLGGRRGRERRSVPATGRWCAGRNPVARPVVGWWGCQRPRRGG